jgi:hypothetical protein
LQRIRGAGSPGKCIGKENEGMMKVVYVMFKKEGMSREEFRSYWKDTHAPVDAEGNEPPYDGFDESSTSRARRPWKRRSPPRKVR